MFINSNMDAKTVSNGLKAIYKTLDNKEQNMRSDYYTKKLVACAIQFDKDFNKMEGGIPALDNITELIFYIGKTMEISNKVEDELDDIDTKCLMYRDVCNKPDTSDTKIKELFQDVAIDFIATCRTHDILDI